MFIGRGGVGSNTGELLLIAGKGKIAPVTIHHALKACRGSGSKAPRIQDLGTTRR